MTTSDMPVIPYSLWRRLVGQPLVEGQFSAVELSLQLIERGNRDNGQLQSV